MDKVLKELKEFRKEIEKIKIFCEVVAEEHDHMPHLRHMWFEGGGNLTYRQNKPWHNDMNTLCNKIMKEFLEFERRIGRLENKG
jgi:hypothetical protein